MSNLVTPMLTSVDKSPIVDFYPATICFSNSTCTIISSSKDHQICLNETPVWNDLEKLVNRSSKYYSSNVSGKDRISCTKKTINNNLFSNEISKNLESKIGQPDSEINMSDNLHLVAFNDLSDGSKFNEQIWNSSNSENNSCAKACVNVNMGYNEGSSMESVVSNLKLKEKNNFPLLNYPVTENINTKSPELKLNMPKTETNSIQSIASLSPSNSRNINQIKTFKNNSKTGHSRLWGSCGSAGTLQLNFDIKSSTDPSCSFDSKPRSQSNVCADTSLLPEAEIRNRSYVNNTNKLKRISQVSFEAEFDSEGRTHEQISIDIRKWDPFIIAGQVTFLELSYFKAIKAEEFMSFKWTALSKHTHAPAIVASTRWFNQLNFWAQRIILECTDLTRRSEMLSYLIRIIKKLVDHYNNLSSGMAVMSALQVECIHRLKHTWNNISNKDKTTFRRMEELFSSENNYEKLRVHIDSLKLPCIPYLGLYLTDLTYINVAHSKLSEFESQTKTDQINNILRTVSEFQQSEYEIVQNPTLYRYLESQRYIEELQKIIEENNYRTSVFLEPNSTESTITTSRQQPDYPAANSLSPQKTPPSYACKHPSNTGYLQSPISPKPMASTLLNESIKEVSEQIPNLGVIQDNKNTAIDDSTSHENIDDLELSHIISNQPSMMSTNNQDLLKGQPTGNLKISDSYMEDDSVHASLLCGSGNRKSNYKKKTGNKTIRFKRDSSCSSHQQVSSKTATMSSGSHTTSIDKDVTALQSMSLLDDSYLDATLTDTCTVPVIGTDVPGQQLMRSDPCNPGLTVKQKEILCSPPICRCKIKGGTVDLKPKSSSNRKTEMRNLVKIAQAAESAVHYSKKITNFYVDQPMIDSENVNENSFDDCPISEVQESVKLICQGVLSRKTCLQNNKKPRFPMWNRYWVVLIVSGSNAYLVYFENSHLRGSERKDFKHKKCHVQDLRGVTISINKPSTNSNLSESDRNLSESPIDSNSPNEKLHELKQFFIIDKEYGTIYKFRDSSGKRRKAIDKIDTENELCLPSTSSFNQLLNLPMWYRLLSNSINRINRPVDNNKDLIVLNDS